MICFLRYKNKNIFNIEDNDTIFINVLNDDGKLDVSLYLTCIYMFIEKFESIIINIHSEMTNSDRMAIVLSKNLSNKISYLIA